MLFKIEIDNNDKYIRAVSVDYINNKASSRLIWRLIHTYS